jgi:hypothetical protein
MNVAGAQRSAAPTRWTPSLSAAAAAKSRAPAKAAPMVHVFVVGL